MSRRKYRENAAQIVYAHLINGKAMDDLIADYKSVSIDSEFIVAKDVDEELLDALYRVEDRSEIYIRVINSRLKKGWEFTRLGRMEQAVLLLALAELEQGIQDKVIIVNEAVEIAKNYGDADSYKLINGVLDSL